MIADLELDANDIVQIEEPAATRLGGLTFQVGNFDLVAPDVERLGGRLTGFSAGGSVYRSARSGNVETFVLVTMHDAIRHLSGL